MAITREEALEIIKGMSSTGIRAQLDPREIHPTDFYTLLYSDAELSEKYVLAQQTRGELLVDEIIEISDTELDPQRARIRVESRRWYASKMMPQKYGDRIDVNVQHSVDISGALTEARQRAAPRIRDASQPQLSAPQNLLAQSVEDNENSHEASKDRVSLDDVDPFS